MEDVSNKLLKGLLAILTVILTNEQLYNTTYDSDQKLLLGILSVLALVFSTNQIISAIQSVKTKKYLLTDGLISDPALEENALRMLQSPSLQRQDDRKIAHLTSRETDILSYMADGLMNKEIAERLYISHSTVKNHVTSILRKLNATVRTEAVIKAIRYGFVKVK